MTPAEATTAPGDVEPSPQAISAENAPAATGTGLMNVATAPEKRLCGAASIVRPVAIGAGTDTVAVLVSETDWPSSSRIVVATGYVPGRA